MKKIRTILRRFVIGSFYVIGARSRVPLPKVRVLVLHQIESAEAFERMLIELKRYHFITPQDFEEGRFKTNTVNVLLTFDDGYMSWISTALPLLRKYDIKATFFISSGFINTYGDDAAQQRFARERLLTERAFALSWDDIRCLDNSGMTIGGHTVNHTYLEAVNEEQAQEEVSRDKISIEKELGHSIAWFAYPYGATVTQRSINAAKNAGYTYGFTTKTGFVEKCVGLTISRSNTNVRGELLTRAWVEGAADVVYSLERPIRDFLKRFV